MTAIYKREIKAYFKTPTGYVFMGVFLCVSAFLCTLTTLHARTSDFSTYFQLLVLVYVVTLPLLTMKSLSEEKKLGTEQLLLTSPIKLWGLIAAKFFSAFTMFLITIGISSAFFIPVAVWGNVNVGRLIGCLIGIILIAMCFISIGIFISSLTENQLTAAMGTIGALAFLSALGQLDSLTSSELLSTVINWLAVTSRYEYFLYGIFDISSALYYISVTAVFLYLSVRVYERRRYA